MTSSQVEDQGHVSSKLQTDDPDAALTSPLVADDVQTPLLTTAVPPQMVPDENFRRTVMIMCYVCIALVEVYAFLTIAPVQEIMEDFICHGQHPDHKMNQPSILDRRCKAPDVQRLLALVRGWWQTCALLVPLLVQIPYGIIADKYGRRPVVFLALFGVLLEGSLSMLILRHPETFSAWALVVPVTAYLIGGGPPMATAMVWTIICDIVPTVERTTAFYRISALAIVMSAVLNPIAAWFMSIDPWLPMWIGISCMALGTLSVLLIPETLHLRRKSDDCVQRRRGSGTSDSLLPTDEPQPTNRDIGSKAYAQELLAGAKENILHIWKFILASKGVMLLITGCGLFFPIRLAFEAFMLQYTTKRFDWSWSTATYYYTITKLTGLVTLLAVLPVVSKFVGRACHDNPLKRDLYMAHCSVAFIILGCFLAAVAYVPAVLVGSLISYGLGVGFLPQVRALASGVVEPHTLATLNTMISSMETIMGSIGAPALGWLTSRGMDLGGAWLGLPFVAATAFALAAAISLSFFRIPASYI